MYCGRMPSTTMGESVSFKFLCHDDRVHYIRDVSWNNITLSIHNVESGYGVWKDSSVKTLEVAHGPTIGSTAAGKQIVYGFIIICIVWLVEPEK
jgi:hypothetical protein